MFNDIINLYEFGNIKTLIENLESRTIDNELLIEVTLKKVDEICPFCESTNYSIKDYQKKKIIHSISNTRKSYILYRRRRYFCKLCKKTFMEKDPFITTNNNVSTLTIMNILEYLKDFNHTFSSAASLYNVSVQTVINIFDQYVNPPPLKLGRVISIDEVHIKSNIKHPYACVILDFEKNKIIDVLVTRKKYKLKDYFRGKTRKELDDVEYVIMDLWSPYRDIVKEFMPKAKIVADSFHVVSLINKVLDKKRLSVMNTYLQNNVRNYQLNYSNDYGYLLKKYSKLLLVSPSNFKNILKFIPKYKMNVYSKTILDHLLNSNDKLKEIYNLRNLYIDFNRNSNQANAKENLDRLIDIFINHEIHEIRECGKTLVRWYTEILNSFETHNGSRYSNGRIEGKNRDIKTIIRNSYGYKNFKRFRARVMYSINKDVAIKI